MLQLRKMFPHGYHKYTKNVSFHLLSIHPYTSSDSDLPLLKKYGRWPHRTGSLLTIVSFMRLFLRLFSRDARSNVSKTLEMRQLWLKLAPSWTLRTSNWARPTLLTSLWNLLLKWRKIITLKCSEACLSWMRPFFLREYGLLSRCG